MKKIYVLFMTFACLSIANVFADSPCDNEMPNQNTRTMQQQNCQKPCDAPLPFRSECFLCTNKNIEDLINEVGLSDTQACTTMKLQEKYEQEVYSLNERICCEEKTLAQLEATCSKWSDRHKQKRLIKRLENDKKKICKCYEEQFKTTLSPDQIREYNRAKK